MFKDEFDKICWILLAAAIIALALILHINRGVEREKQSAGLGKAVEREMAFRSKVEFVVKLYSPVESLHKEGNNQMALLKLDELIRKYPGEAHGYILQGQILREMGTLDEAISSYVAGVKLNGDYVDAKSPLTHRAEIKQVVDEGLEKIGQRQRASSDSGNHSFAVSLQKINYLKSRLAGGCE